MINLENIFRKPIIDQEELDLKPSFAIFKRNPNQADKYLIVGNGFFVNSNGEFVTAGHVFKNEGEFFIGFPEENKNIKLFPIRWSAKIYRIPYDYEEYNNNTYRNPLIYQKGQEYKDIGVGKVNLSNTPYLELATRRPRRREELTVDGFRRNNSQPRDGVLLINRRIPNGYWFYESFTYVCNQRIGLYNLR